MKVVKWIVILLLPIGLIAFLPQTFQTAEVEGGSTSLTASTMGEYFNYGFMGWYVEGTGVRSQISCHYTFGKAAPLIVFGYAGMLVNQSDLGLFDWGDDPKISFWPSGGIGVQAELVEKPSLALQFSAEFPTLLSLTFLAGINSRQINREIVTIGIKTTPGPVDFLPIIPSSVFITVHPTPRLHILAGGTALWMVGGEVHAGVGYTILNK